MGLSVKSMIPRLHEYLVLLTRLLRKTSGYAHFIQERILWRLWPPNTGVSSSAFIQPENVARVDRLWHYLGLVNLVADPESSVVICSHRQHHVSVAIDRQIFLKTLCIFVPLHYPVPLYPHWNQLGILLCEAPYNHVKIQRNIGHDR